MPRRLTPEEIQSKTELDNLPGIQQGRLNPEQTKRLKRMLRRTRSQLELTDMVEGHDDVIGDLQDNILNAFVDLVALFVPDDEQAPEGTYERVIPPN